MASIATFLFWAVLAVCGAIVGIMVAIKLLGLIWAVLSDAAGIIFAVIVVLLFWFVLAMVF